MHNRKVKVMFIDWYRQFDLSRVEREFEWRVISKHWDLELSDKPDILFYSNYGDKHMQYTGLRVFVSMENVRPDFDVCDYAFTFDYPINDRNYRMPLYRRCGEYKDLLLPRDVEEIVAQNRKFCSFMVSNPKAKERIDFYNKLSAYRPIDSGGRYLNNIGGQVEVGRQNKEAWMRNYKFNICFENNSHPGYTTEKILEAFVANTIPIYWGNPLVDLDFNPRAFINCHDFDSLDEVIELVKEIDQNDSLYREYLSQPYLKDNVETEFCKEENILARYDEIISSKKVFISPFRKNIQRSEYRLAEMRKVVTKAKRKVSVYSKHALNKLGIPINKKN